MQQIESEEDEDTSVGSGGGSYTPGSHTAAENAISADEAEAELLLKGGLIEQHPGADSKVEFQNFDSWSWHGHGHGNNS